MSPPRGTANPRHGGRGRPELYVVLLRAEPLVVVVDEAPSVKGLRRSEFVVARSEEEAIEKARRKVRARIEGHPAIEPLDPAAVEITVESVDTSRQWWRLVAPQGSVFYPVEAPED